MDIQPAFNECKAVAYMCQYFSETESHCSQVMKQAAKEAFENNMHHHDTMKKIAKAYLIIESVLRRRQFTIFCQTEAKDEFCTRLCILLKQFFQRKEFNYYFIEKNLVTYQTIIHIFSRNQILILIWKDQVRHSPMENTVS